MTKARQDLVVIVLALLAWGFACDNTNSTSERKPEATPSSPATSPSPTPAPIAISAVELFKAYEENEVAADGKYKGKLLKVSGTIKSVGKNMFDETAVSLNSGDIFREVECIFDSNLGLAELKKGQKIVVQGTGDGKKFTARLIDCVILTK